MLAIIFENRFWSDEKENSGSNEESQENKDS